MLDALIYARPIARKQSDILEKLQVAAGHYALVTIHRAANTDDPERLFQIMTAINSVSETVVLPVHPRTAKALESLNISFNDHIRLIDPVGYFDMLVLEENARLIATDSGGVQRESYYLGVPCLTLRDETEWIATVKAGWNKLVGVDPNMILGNWFNFAPPVEHPSIYGDGSAARQIVESLSAVAMEMQKHDQILDSRMPALGREERK